MTEKPADNGAAEPARDEPRPPRGEPESIDDLYAVRRTPELDAPRPAAGDSGTLPLPGDGSGTRPLPADEPGTRPLPAEEQATVQLDKSERANPEPAAAEPAWPAATAQQPAGPAPGFVPPPPPPPAGGFPPPPPGGFPPPSGSFFPPPQPTGGAFATRYGLIRPRQGRWFAGVAAAIGRATNTDPVLWRVLLAVLALFGGVGLLVYLLGWLLIPSEGDTASAAEALIGRGRSSTSAPLALGLGILALIMFAVAFSGNIRSSLLGAAVIVGAALLVSRGGSALGRPASTPPQNGPPDTPPPFAPPASTMAMGPHPTGSYPTGPYPTGPYPPGMNPTPMAEPVAMGQTTVEPPSGYRPPFAPHGPYASSSPYAQSLGYVPPPPPEYPGLAQMPRPPKPPRVRSRLGRVTLSLICLALGVLAIVDVAGASVPGAAYVAAALGVVGLGLFIGAWMGRARWLILPGLALTLALVIVSSAENGNFDRRFGPRGDVTWTPASVSELSSGYTVDAGNGTLDLSTVDFRDHSASVDVHVDVGKLVVILPPNVDVDITAKVDGGSADVLGQRWGGLGNDSRQVRDNGADGPGGGHLLLAATVDLGKLEVHR